MKHTLRQTILITLAAIASIGCASNYEDNFFLGDGSGAYEENYPQGGDQFTDYGENGFMVTATNPNSTFSVDADGASYSVLRAYLNRYDNLPPKAAIRTEEMLNYFTFDYPEPTNGHTVSLSHELTQCPWNEEHLLLRVGLKGAELTNEALPSNYVFMIDVSGSMASNDKLPLLKQGLRALAESLTAQDRLSIVTYSGNVEVLLEGVAGNNYDEISQAIDRLSAGGVTNGGKALVMAYNLAKACYIEGGNNRVIIGTDGDFNVGMTSTEELVEYVEQQLESNIYLSVMGFGLGNLNDAMMESLAGHGNGTYNYIDCTEQMVKVYIHERHQLQAVSKDTKIKVAFDPAMVEKWRLIGYENRVMSEEEFEDTKKDAGEIGAGQTITALYELIPTSTAVEEQALSSTGANLLASCEVRYKESVNDTEHNLLLNIEPTATPLLEASSEIKWAASLAAMSMLSRGSEYAGSATVEMVSNLAREGAEGPSAASADPYGYRQAHLALLDKWADAIKLARR